MALLFQITGMGILYVVQLGGISLIVIGLIKLVEILFVDVYCYTVWGIPFPKPFYSLLVSSEFTQLIFVLNSIFLHFYNFFKHYRN